MNRKALKKVALLLTSVTLFSLLGFLSAPVVVAQSPSISITPTNGHVGDLVVVNGTVDTVDGNFTVRWNHALNFTGVAKGNNASLSFSVRPTVGAPFPSGRNITVELIDETLDIVAATTNFTLFTNFDMQIGTPPPPRQLQEGTSVRFNITVTAGEPNSVYTANITVSNAANQTHSIFASLSNTTTSGSGSANVTYPTGFPAGASMNYTGIYKAFFNETITKDFSVGLTDKTEYRRNEDVLLQASGYKPAEVVQADIRIGESSAAGFPKNITASSGGLVILSWEVPLNATSGTYSIALTNTTIGGTVKTPSDTQNFTVIGVVCLVEARNLANEAFEGALIEVYNASAPTLALTDGSTNSTGWIKFNLDGGNYTFKAFVRNVEVCEPLNKTITSDTKFLLTLRLVNFVATVETEAGERIPLVDIALSYNYTARDNSTIAATSITQTNATGIAALKNLFTDTTYRVGAKRYGMLFNTTTLIVESLPASPLLLDLTLPTYTLSVHALDSKDSDAAGVDIRVYEWTSGVTTPLQSMETNLTGKVFFSLPFGRYALKGFRSGIFLSEAVIDLDEPLTFTFNLRTLNVDVTVFVFDYFGQPIANAEVKIERKAGQNFEMLSSQFTGSAGSVHFTSLVGGESRLSVYIAGKRVGVQTQFLGSDSDEVVFRAGEYVALLGYPVATGAFALGVFLILALVVVGLTLTRKRILGIFRRKPKR